MVEVKELLQRQRQVLLPEDENYENEMTNDICKQCVSRGHIPRCKVTGSKREISLFLQFGQITGRNSCRPLSSSENLNFPSVAVPNHPYMVLILSFLPLLTLPPIILTRFRGIKSGFFHPPVSKLCITLLLLQSASKGTL